MARRYTRRPVPENKIPNKSIGEKISDAFEILPICGKMKCPISLMGNRQIIVEDVKEILYIDENMVSVGSGKGAVQIMGSYLTLCSINEDSVMIIGEITSVDFSF